MAFVYYRVWEGIQTASKSPDSNIARVKYFPFVLVLCYFWATVRRFYELGSDGLAPVWLAGMATFFSAALVMFVSFFFVFFLFVFFLFCFVFTNTDKMQNTKKKHNTQHTIHTTGDMQCLRLWFES